MSTQLDATQRLEFHYSVDGANHVFRHYCQLVASGDASGYDLVPRAPGANFGASLGIDRLWTLLQGIFDSSKTTFGTVILQQLSGVAWNPLSFYVTAVAPTSGSAYVKAGQLTLTLRDMGFHKVRGVWLETVAPVGFKGLTTSAFGAPYTALFNSYTSVGTIANHDPFHWVRGRSDLYLQSFVSFVTDLNDKVRRRRGIA
jgi:hypothetical protein